MSKTVRDRKMALRLASPLYEVLEQEAVAKRMPSVSAHVRAILIEHAEARMVGREAQEAA